MDAHILQPEANRAKGQVQNLIFMMENFNRGTLVISGSFLAFCTTKCPKPVLPRTYTRLFLYVIPFIAAGNGV